MTRNGPLDTTILCVHSTTPLSHRLIGRTHTVGDTLEKTEVNALAWLGLLVYHSVQVKRITLFARD